MVTSVTHRSPGINKIWNETAADGGLRTWANQVLNRHPAVGLAVCIFTGDEASLFAHGWSDIASKTPITPDTVFRVGSITKTMTAIAVMQLWECGLIGLDSPAQEYLTSFPLVPLDPDWQPVTIRHLLTHTAGIPDVLHVGHLLHPSWGPFEGRPPLLSVEAGGRLPSLAEYYRSGLPVIAEPGSEFAYSNHGFAALGRIVEEIAGQTLEGYFRQHIFEPLGMTSTSLARSADVEKQLARGYELGRRGPMLIADREWIGAGGGGVYSSSRDMVRYAQALLGGGSDKQGSILAPATVEMMFEYQYRGDPRLNGVGLGFFRHDVEHHRLLGHDGILPGFNSTLVVSPDGGVGVAAFTNGSKGAMAWLPSEVERLMCRLIGITGDLQHGGAPQHPEMWDRLCGRYRLPPVGDLRGRIAMAGGVEVLVAAGHLMIRILTPIPALYRGFPLLPDDEDDPFTFRVDLSQLGMGPVRLAFASDENGRRAIHTDLGGQPISLYEIAPQSSLHPSFGSMVKASTQTMSGIATKRRPRKRGSR